MRFKNSNQRKAVMAKLQKLNVKVNSGLYVYKHPKLPGIGDYKILIRSSGSTAHTAFRKSSNYKKWLETTGLKEKNKGHTPFGSKKSRFLIGKYKEISYKGNQKLLDNKAKKENWKPIKYLDNGQYIRAYVSKGKVKSIHYLNPNYNPRKLKYVHE